MISYTKKKYLKLALFIAAVVIGTSSLLYTNFLVKKLAREERFRVELWAEAMKEIERNPLKEEINNVFYKLINENITIPVIIADSLDNILFNNYDIVFPNKILQQNDEDFLKNQLKKMKNHNEPIILAISDIDKQYIYFKDSTLLTKLTYYPYIQLSIITLFILIAYISFSTSRKAEQDQVWIGMSKETAHQLGTPISSLIAWVELLKLKEENHQMISEVEKDVERLQTITERFSKIGAAPVLEKRNITEVLTNAISYIRKRTSSKVIYNLNFNEKDEILVPINQSLFDWVIENICKNAIDAIEGEGKIEISVKDNIQVIYIDIKDSGKGIPKSKFQTIFRPGFTTKKRGWGLGLTLSKRIIEVNHGGKLFVKSSDVNNGTVFRIVLKK